LAGCRPLPYSLGHPGVNPALAFNTAVSFTTNTSWQNYPGETTLGGLAQAAGLGTEAFLSAAVGLSGLYGLLMVVLIAGFLGGLMISRAPEFLRKRIRAPEMRLVALYYLATPLALLAGVAIALPAGRAAILNAGPHGLTEVIYAFARSANSNGSAFGGLSGNTAFYNVALAVVMLAGRYLPIVFVLALAGSFARQKPVAVTSATLRTHGPTFTALTVGVALVLVFLTFRPALSLGPLRVITAIPRFLPDGGRPGGRAEREPGDRIPDVRHAGPQRVRRAYGRVGSGQGFPVSPALSPVEQSGFAAELIAALSDAAELTIDRIAHEVTAGWRATARIKAGQGQGQGQDEQALAPTRAWEPATTASTGTTTATWNSGSTR
jgi:hypothetical protein